MSMYIHVKFSRPTRFDCSPFGTVSKVIINREYLEDKYEYYIQISEDEKSPNWVTWDYLLGLILKEKITDKDFVSKCLDAFKTRSHKDKKSFGKNISEIVNELFD